MTQPRRPELPIGYWLRQADTLANAEVKVDDLIAEGDRVVMRYRWAADHTGPIMGIPATGKRVEMPGILIARIANGKLAEYWRQEDMLGLL